MIKKTKWLAFARGPGSALGFICPKIAVSEGGASAYKASDFDLFFGGGTIGKVTDS